MSSPPTASRSKATNADGVSAASLATREAAGCRRSCSAIEVEAVRAGDDDLAVDDAAGRERRQQQRVQLGEVAIERPQIAALDEDVGVAAEDDGAEAVPLRLEEERTRAGSASASLASIGSIGGASAKPSERVAGVSAIECDRSGSVARG